MTQIFKIKSALSLHSVYVCISSKESLLLYLLEKNGSIPVHILQSIINRGILDYV